MGVPGRNHPPALAEKLGEQLRVRAVDWGREQERGAAEAGTYGLSKEAAQGGAERGGATHRAPRTGPTKTERRSLRPCITKNLLTPERRPNGGKKAARRTSGQPVFWAVTTVYRV